MLYSKSIARSYKSRISVLLENFFNQGRGPHVDSTKRGAFDMMPEDNGIGLQDVAGLQYIAILRNTLRNSDHFSIIIL